MYSLRGEKNPHIISIKTINWYSSSNSNGKFDQIIDFILNSLRMNLEITLAKKMEKNINKWNYNKVSSSTAK